MKYTNARYPDKINDLVDNDGNVNIPEKEWNRNTILEENRNEANRLHDDLESIVLNGSLPRFTEKYNFTCCPFSVIQNIFDRIDGDAMKLLFTDYMSISESTPKLFLDVNIHGQLQTAENDFRFNECGFEDRFTVYINTDAETGEARVVTTGAFDVCSGIITLYWDPDGLWVEE